MKNEEDYLIFMFPKKQFESIEEMIEELSTSDLKDNLPFQHFVKKFHEQLFGFKIVAHFFGEAALIANKSERSIYRYIKSEELYAYKTQV